MDPDAALADIRLLLAQIVCREQAGEDTRELLEKLREKTEALIDWMDCGGYVPRAWTKNTGEVG